MSTTIEDLFDSIEDVESEAVEARQLLYTVEDELLKLKRENAKLRELARDLRACNGSCPRCLELMGKCEYEERMRELGIEVD